MAIITEFKSKNLQDQQLEFLEETFEHYSEDFLDKQAKDDNSCKYRLGKKRCAIGRYIQDKKYNSIMEGKTVSASEVFDALPEHIKNLSTAFLIKMQNTHDFAKNTEDFIDRVEETKKNVLAGKYIDDEETLE